MLALHTVWGFYRDKWALRRIDGFRQYLVLADEFAWACYEPAMKAHEKTKAQARAKRAPPLVFLGPVHGPWSLARGDSAQEDLDEDLVQNTVVYELVRQLPLSVVAVPWHHLSHLRKPSSSGTRWDTSSCSTSSGWTQSRRSSTRRF